MGCEATFHPRESFHMTKCPHCGKTANPLTLALSTDRAPYRCPACRKVSRIKRWTLFLATFVCIIIAFAVRNQAGLSGIADFSIFFATVLITMTGSIWLFVRLRPIRQEPDNNLNETLEHDAKLGAKRI